MFIIIIVIADTYKEIKLNQTGGFVTAIGQKTSMFEHTTEVTQSSILNPNQFYEVYPGLKGKVH